MISLNFSGILESFSRGMHAATTYKFMRPGPVKTEPSPPAASIPAELIATPINNYNVGNDGDVNISSTMMPTISGVLQRVGKTNTNILNWFRFKRNPLPQICATFKTSSSRYLIPTASPKRNWFSNPWNSRSNAPTHSSARGMSRYTLEIHSLLL